MARATPVNSGYTIINGSGGGPNGNRIDVWVEYKVNSQSATNNTSNITAYFYAALRSGQSSSTHHANDSYSTFKINGVNGTGLHNKGAYDFRTTSPNLFGTWTGNISHNNDGKKSVSVSASFTTSSSWITGGSVSGTITLPTIPRYSTINSWSLGSATHNSFKISYSVTPSNSTMHYRIGSGSWTAMPSNGVVTGRSPDTTYSVTIRATHPDSGLTTVSSAKSIKTLGVPTISSWSLGSATHNSFKITYSVSPAGSTVHYRIGSGSWVAISSGGTVSGLSPGTSYSITIRATHPDSGLTTTSSAKSIKTLEVVSTVSLSHNSRALGSAITITISRGSSAYTHTIQHNFSGSYANIATGVGTSHSWTLPANLANHITSATSKQATIRVRTYRGSTHIGDKTISLTATVPSNSTYNPSISGLAASISGSGRDKTIGKYVQGLSKASVSFTANLKYGATAIVQKIRVDTTDFNGRSITTGTLSKSGSISIVATLTDSRGRTTTSSISITVHAYATPRITKFEADRVPGTKNATVSRSVTFTGLSGDNPLSMLIRIRPVGGSWSNLQNLTGQTSNISGSVTATGLVDTASYEVTVTATDSFGRKATADVVFGTVSLALSINKNMGIGVGKIHEGRANLEVSGTAEINGSPMVFFADYEEW